VKAMESHGKAICFRKIKRENEKKKIKKLQTSKKQALISVEIDTHFMHYNAGKYVQ